MNAFVFNVGTVEGRTPNQSVTQNGKTAAEKYAGMFFDVGQISSSELVDGDGTTNTLMISENLDAGPWTSLAENRIGLRGLSQR